ncbi:MAG TPA: hypothetical protein EYP98_21130 [Planctomycetes bacterium]|nr:hypothetical protein [Planctomycetota bacterium]
MAAAAAFLLAFSWQRSHSSFLRIEQERGAAAGLVGMARHLTHTISVADALALRDLVGLHATQAAWAKTTSEFASLVQAAYFAQTLSLAPVGADGPEVLSAIRRAIGQLTDDAVAVRRFLLLRERFAARG